MKAFTLRPDTFTLTFALLAYWYFEPIDMIRKLLMTSAIFVGCGGGEAECISLYLLVIVCLLAVFIFARFRPLAYGHGNDLQVIVHISMAANYAR